MTKFYYLSLFLCLILYSCGQTRISNQAHDISKPVYSKDTKIDEQLIVDTSKIAILPHDTSNHWVFENSVLFQLTNQDLQTIDGLLNDCINSNNSKQDTTKGLSEYINLKNYKRQYVPFINSKGEKKVYINCFCFPGYADEFDYWKKSLVDVDDGGSCFFHLTINLTSKQYEQLYTNGYG